jgi:hypothetical protein
MNVIITETQNRQSFRRGDAITVKSLTGAKIAASKRQVYQGTFLTIKDADTGEVLATRDTSRNGWRGEWTTELAGME